jgi:tRNA threonylcarbamoyladenosine dehydratase
MKHKRLEMLFGEEAHTDLTKKKVLLLGVGGVGSFCLDCLYRSGIEDITIVDFDVYDESNQNRQMWSELHCGESKVEALKSHYPNVVAIHKKIDKEWVETFDFEPYDLVLDAIDDIHAKIALVHKTHHKLIASMGSAKRLDPTKMDYISIWKTSGDKFASKMRYELRKSGFRGDFMVMFTTEEPNCKEKGSFVAVTGAFGLGMCAKAVERLRT